MEKDKFEAYSWDMVIDYIGSDNLPHNTKKLTIELTNRIFKETSGDEYPIYNIEWEC